MGKADDCRRLALLEAQRALREAQRALVIIIAGVDGAGRHAVINALTHGFDTRGVRVHAWTPESAPGAHRPPFWRYWQALPARGQIGLFLDGWYTAPIEAAFRGEEACCETLKAFEAQLAADGAVLVKLWVDLDVGRARAAIRTRIKAEDRAPTVSEQCVLAAQDDADDGLTALREQTGEWTVVPGGKSKRAAKAAIDGVIEALQNPDPVRPARRRARRPAKASPLAQLDLDARLGKQAAKRDIDALQAELARRLWAAHRREQPVVMLLEGWDAAGKGGVIRRVTAPLDARLFQVVPIAAPNDEERARPYLWRFWRQLPRDGHMTIFDRSWYGRVLVERVEGFAQPHEWQRAYGEINDFEAQLVAHGTVLVKLWLHISPEEQLRRFAARAETPHKQHKLTEEDWRNRDQWGDYLAAVDEMIARTDRPGAPWTLVPANSKPYARRAVLQTLVNALDGD